MLLLIIIRGSTIKVCYAMNPNSNSLTDLGGVLFSQFSVGYYVVSYLLFRSKPLGKRLFAPLVLLFVAFGFMSEIINPIEIN